MHDNTDLRCAPATQYIPAPCTCRACSAPTTQYVPVENAACPPPLRPQLLVCSAEPALPVSMQCAGVCLHVRCCGSGRMLVKGPPLPLAPIPLHGCTVHAQGLAAALSHGWVRADATPAGRAQVFYDKARRRMTPVQGLYDVRACTAESPAAGHMYPLCRYSPRTRYAAWQQGVCEFVHVLAQRLASTACSRPRPLNLRQSS